MIGVGSAAPSLSLCRLFASPMNPQPVAPLRSILSITLFVVLSLGVLALSLNLGLILIHRWL